MRAGARLFPPRYRDPKRVARGGMGDVYRATDAELDRTVAIKVLADRYAADPEVGERFTREALAAARLSSGPSTVTIYDVGSWRGRPFIVMEYLAGGSLADVFRRDGSQPLERALGWLAQAGAALDYAHAHGVVHRDVKPANLLLDREGNVHVADFGVASAAGLASITQTGTVLGTVGYLAPEQAAGETATAAADRYALAVVAFEALTGARPFPDAGVPTAETVPFGVPSVSAHNASLGPELDPVFDRALAEDPQARFGSCAELVATLTAVSAGAFATAPTRVAHRGRRRPRPLLVGLPLAVVVGVGAVTALVVTDKSTRTPGPVGTHVATSRARRAPAPRPPAAQPAREPPGLVRRHDRHRGHPHGHGRGRGHRKDHDD